MEVIAFVHVLAKTSVYTRKHVWQRLSTVRLPAHRPLKERPVLAPTVAAHFFYCLLLVSSEFLLGNLGRGNKRELLSSWIYGVLKRTP